MAAEQATRVEKTPWHLWVIGIFGLLWSSMGAMDYILTQTKNEEYMSSFTPEQLDFFYSLPSWIDGLWAIGVWGGVAGSILLLLRKRFAIWAFLASMLAMIITTFHNFVLSNGMEVNGGTSSLVLTGLIIVISIALVLYSRAMDRRSVLA